MSKRNKSKEFWVKRLKIASPKNSYCSSAKLNDLNWSTDWWSDNSFNKCYIHVPHLDGETIHRVYCRLTSKPRIGLNRGVLSWYVDASAIREHPPTNKGGAQ